MEAPKCDSEIGIGAPCLMDEFRQLFSKRRDSVLELGDGFLPFDEVFGTVGKEGVDGFNQLRRLGQIGVKDFAFVLPKDGAFGGLE